VNNKLYLVARGNEGIHTRRLDANDIWIRLALGTPEWSDEEGWKDVSNYSTIQTAVVSNKLHLVARGNEGIHTWRLEADDTRIRLTLGTPEWSDEEGWKDVTNYSTIQTDSGSIDRPYALRLAGRYRRIRHRFPKR
jgi:hypothetical protein